MTQYIRSGSTEESDRQSAALSASQKTDLEFLKRVRSLVKLGDSPRILDLGCGNGVFTRLIAEVFPDCQVVGWDAEPLLIQSAKAIESSRLQFQLRSFDAPLSTADEAAFDIVIFRQVLMDVPDPVGLLDWAKRLLKKSGYVAAMEPDYSATIIHPTIDVWSSLYKNYKTWAKDGGENFEAGRHLGEQANSAGLRVEAFFPVVNFLSQHDTEELHRFVESEVKSVSADRARLESETDINAGQIDEFFSRLRQIPACPGSYIQTQMNGLVARV